MLSRVAASLYWLGRYVERAEFTARLVEATVRLDALSTRPAGEVAWTSALAVTEAHEAFEALHGPVRAASVARFLTLSSDHPASVVACLDRARDNAKAVRTALTREAWESINRAWLLFNGRELPDNMGETLALVERAQRETRAFDGALGRMLRNPATWFIRLGAAVERGDNAARLLDVKYHILLPEGELVGGVVDRDQWTTILQTVAAVNAYRWLYRDGLKPWNVAELLTLRVELPRSIAAAAEEVSEHLIALSRQTGLEGEADAAAEERCVRLANTGIDQIITYGLHEYLEEQMADIAELDRLIARQFRFG